MPIDGRLGVHGPIIVISVWTGATLLAVLVGLVMLLKRYLRSELNTLMRPLRPRKIGLSSM